MASKDQTLTIEPREKTGTGPSNALRRGGRIPAVLYGHGAPPQHVSLEARALEDFLTHGGRSGVITLMMNGSRADTAMVRDIRRHAVTHKIEHVDLQRVSEHEAVRATVNVITTGVARGVRDLGGVMDVILHQLDVEGPADELPEHIEVDVTELGIHEHVTAGQVALPKNLKMLTPADTLVVSIEASKTARQVEEAGTTPGEQAQPEIIGAKTEE